MSTRELSKSRPHIDGRHNGIADYRGRGAGGAVLTALIEAARATGMHKLTSRVFPENAGSRALLKRLGFEEIGMHRRHGKLDGLWRDCVIVERLLDEDQE
jgi:L-amino acid N-acyltransferase YncA